MTSTGSNEPRPDSANAAETCARCGKPLDGLRDVMVHTPTETKTFCDFACAEIWKMNRWTAEFFKHGVLPFAWIDKGNNS